MDPHFHAFLRPFQAHGFEEDSYMRETDLVAVLDRSLTNHTQQFDRNIFRELWENTLKNEEGDCVLLKDYVETLCEAQEILREKIRRAQGKYAAEINESKKRELMIVIYSLSEDEKALCAPFSIESAPSKLTEHSRLSVHPAERTSLSIFTGEVSVQHKVSLGLSLAVWATGGSLLLDLVGMLGRFNFYALLVDLLVAAVFLLNYFDRVYIRLLFLTLLLAVVHEAAWLAMRIDDYWLQEDPNWNSGRAGFMRFVVVSTIISCACKSLLAVLLFRFRDSPHGLRKKALFLFLEFNLDANPLRNPITAVATRVLPRFLIR